MARSKRTDRAEARRRYRAYLAHLEEGEGEAGEFDPDEIEARPASRSAEKTTAVRPGQRLGLVGAFKAAMRPIHYGEDLRYLPTLITRTPAIWVPTAISLICAALAFSRMNSGTIDEVRADFIIQITLGFALSPAMPMLPAFIAGFFAPRASWLAGAVAALATTALFGVVAAQRPEVIWEKGATMSAGDVAAMTASLMLYSLPLGALLAAFSAWYKRFLALSGPGGGLTQQRSGGKQSRRPASKRR